jgi:Zn-dependent protease/CBS domain-containing protein
MRIGSLFGIEINIHVSWIFVFALVTWALSSPGGPLHLAGDSPLERAALGLLGSLLFFGSVLLHELAHSLLARRRGIAVNGITLFIFGGVSSIDTESTDAPGEAWISGIGPLTSLALAAVFYGLARIDPSSALGGLFTYLGAANVLLAIFNLVPAYPLDGGRVLHALIWRVSGDRVRATTIAANVGRAIAVLIVAWGIVEAVFADVLGGLWISFIGWFLLQAGNAERSRIVISGALAGHLAGELAAPAELHVGPDAFGDRALALMQQSDVQALPVVLGDRVIGVVPIASLLHRSLDDLAGTPVTALMTRPAEVKVVPATVPAIDGVKQLAAGGGFVGLTAPDGEIVAIVTPDSVMRWLAGARRAGVRA